MTLSTAIEILEKHQLWRRGKIDDMPNTPREYGLSIDRILKAVDHRKSDYVIRFPFKHLKDVYNEEIEIINDNLHYCEIERGNGAQTNKTAKDDLVREKCKQIADLIREVELLTK